MLALGIVERIIWVGTGPSRFGCSDAISVVTRC